LLIDYLLGFFMRTLLLGLFATLWSSLAIGQTLYTFNGGGTSGSWDDASIWTTDPTGSTSIGARVPAANDNVVVTNSFVVLLNSSVTTAGLSVTVQRGGVLDLTSATSGFASTLTRLAGQGTLRIGRPYFPAVTTNNFDDANTGTVEFYNWPAGPTALPIPSTGQYNNLRLLNTTATAYTTQLDNNLTLMGSLTLMRTNTSVTGPLVTFNLGKTASTNRTLTIQSNVTVGAGTFLGVSAVAGLHTLNVNGSFVNNGTVNLHNGADDTQSALLLFGGAADANFACNGPTDLSQLRVNKGIDSQVLLNVTSTVNSSDGTGNLHLNYVSPGNILDLVAGVTKFGNNIVLPKIHNGTAQGTGTDNGFYNLGSTSTSPTLWIAGATIQNNSADARAFILYGTLRVSLGTFECLTQDALVMREDGQILIEGGTSTVEKYRPSSTSSTHRGSFIITGGLFNCRGLYASGSTDQFARFSMPYLTQSFRMTGGTIRVENPSTNGTDGLFHIGVNPNNAIVSGGTIEIYLPNSNIDGKILTTAPLWNLTIKKPVLSGGTTSKAILANVGVQTTPTDYTSGATTAAQPITVLNNFTLDATNPTTFDAANLNVTIQGTLTVGAGCTYLPGTNTTTFSGGQNQLLVNNGTIGTTANVGTFNNLTVNKSAGTLTLGGSVTTYAIPSTATLSLLKGVLNDGGKTINVQGNLINSASHSSGGGTGSIILSGAGGQTITGDGTGVFGNLKINSTAAVGSVAVTLLANITVVNILTLQSSHLFAIGANRLAITNVNTNAIGPVGGFNNQRMIQTAGNQSDLGLQKTYGGPTAYTFPVGTGTKYTPATITLQLATGLSKYGQVSVSPTNARNPFVASATNSLAYYWKVRSIGFGPIPTGAIYETFNMIDTDGAGTLANYIAGRYLPVAWDTSYSGGITDYSTYSEIAFNGLDQFDGEFTAGEPDTFGPITAFYSRTSGNWEAPATWSTAGYNGAQASTVPSAGNPVFIGSASNGAYHTVKVTANAAQAGSLVIDRNSVLDVQGSTSHNFGALPDSKPGGSGTLRIGSTTTKIGSTVVTTTEFPGGDFGSFLQYGGGTVEYYTSTNAIGAQVVTLPTTSASNLSLGSYKTLVLNPIAGSTITLPNLDLRLYSQLKVGTSSTYTGDSYLSGAAAGDLRIDSLLAVQTGALHFSNGTVRKLTLDTNLQLNSGATFDTNGSGTAVANAVTVGGSIINNGTLDFNMAGKTANLTFLGSQNANLTSSGALTDLYTLTVNKGLDRTGLLNLDGAGSLTTPPNGWLTLTNGTLRFAKPNATLTIHDGVATPYLITDNAGLTVDASGGTVTVATNNNATADLKLAGQLQVLQGTLRVGTAGNVGNDLEYASAGAPGLKVTGGNLYVNGQIRRTIANLDGALRFDQSGGTIDIDGQGAAASQNNERGLFEVQGKGSIFRMSAGTLNLHRSNNKSPILTADLYLAPDSTVVTAGTVVLGNSASGVGNVTISVNSTIPLYDLRIETGANSTNTNTGLLTGVIPLTLKGSLTIGNDNSFFNANGLGLNIYQHLVNNNTSASTALNVGGFQPITTTQTTSFMGGVATQQLTGTATNLTVFGSLALNNPQTSGTLQLGGNVLTAGTLTLTKGTLDDNGKTITTRGDVLNSSTHFSGGPGTGSLILAGTTNQNIGGNGAGRFGNVTLNNSVGVTSTANQEITKVLTLTSGVFTIGSNLLWLSNPAAEALAGTPDATRFIRTNGIVADLGLRKNYPNGASNFTFPVGAAAKYTPVQMNVTANSAAGTITVQPIDLAHPSTTGTGANKITFYWKVSSTLASPTVTQQFTYGANDVVGKESLYKVGRFYKGAWTPVGGITASSVTVASHTLTNPGYSGTDGTIAGDYTGAESSEFGVVPTFYSRNATAGLTTGAVWTDASAWTNNADGTDSAPLPTTFPTLANPVVILPGHLITSTSASRSAASLLLQGTLDLGTYGANNFNTVTGTGTMRIGSALFPAGNYSAFMASNGGSVDYTGAVQLPARDTYNNLTFSGGNGKQLSNLDLTLNGALTVAAGTTVDNSTSQNITLTSATSGATLNGTFNLNDGALTTGAFLTNNGSLTLGAGLLSIGTNLTNSGTLTNGSGNVTVGSAFSNLGTYNANVGTGSLTVGTTFANSGNYTAGAGKLVANGDFSNAAGSTFTAASGDVNISGSLSNAGTYTVKDGVTNNFLRVAGNFSNLSSGSFSAAVSTLSLQGNFSNSGSFDPGSGLVQFITDTNRTLTGSTIFYDVQKVGTGYLMLGANTNVTVADMLTLRNGLIYTGTTNKISLTKTNAQPIVGASTTSYVAGRLAISLPNTAGSIRVFPVGLGTRYRPVTITSQASTNPVVLVEIFNGAPTGSLDATLSNMSSNRYYRIQLLSGTITQPTVQLSFNNDVMDEEVHVPGNLRVAKSSSPSGPWSTAGGAGVFSPADPTGYTTSAAASTTINSTSFFALASTNKVDNPLTGTPPVPLPVKLVVFTAVRQGSAVQVAWVTASEQNSAYFSVQRSADGRTFSDLQRVAAQGSSTSRHDYAALDASPLPGLSYYRLRQVDNDGKESYSPAVAVRFEGQQTIPTLLAYPNPATAQGFQVLATNLSTTGGTVQVFDNLGRLVLTHVAATAEATIHPNRPLASGIYFVTWQAADGLKLTTKVVVE
jgi:fibronectin-binding autotransporter adhesin